jgi:hypothetical protein
LITTATTLARLPTGSSLPQRLAWAELKAAYRLVDRASAQPDNLQAVHREQTHARMLATRGPVLLIHDPTVLTYTDHVAVADQLGPITDSDARGFIQHDTLAVDPMGHQFLGLRHQQTFCRELKPEGETRAQRYRRADRESETWITAMQVVGRMPDDACGVHIGDRAADFFGLMATARATSSHFLIRLVQDRASSAPQESAGDTAEGEYTWRLIERARQVAVTATKEVAVGSRGGRPARVAALSLGSVRLTIRPPHAEPRWRTETPLTLTVVRIWESNPPAGVEPLEWIVGTDFSDQSADGLLRYCEWYEWRWPTVEEYHKVQKTGLGVERLRFETRDRLRAAIALLGVVAVRVLGLRWCREGMPEAPVERVASGEELRVLAALSSTRPPPTTVRQFVDAVAKLGGWLGRKCDGPPGWGSIWRGYQRLADLVLGVELAQTIPRQTQPKPARSGIQTGSRVGFPIARIGAIISLACGAVVNLGFSRYAGKGEGEVRLLRQLWDELRPGGLWVGDRLMSGWVGMHRLKERGVDTVSRRSAHRRADFRKGTRLGQDDHLVVWKKPTSIRSVTGRRTTRDPTRSPSARPASACRRRVPHPVGGRRDDPSGTRADEPGRSGFARPGTVEQ